MVGVVAALVALACATRAEAKHIRYLGPHPIVAKRGGGYCYIEVPHMHAYAPDHTNLYQRVGDEYVFTGDPTPFGYDGDKHTFYGHHPVVTVTGEPVYCLIDGPHFHAYAPPETPDYKVKGDVAFYIGPPLPVRPAQVKVVNAEYRPYVDLRPVVTVEPPPEFHAEVYVPGPPGVVVNAPAPPNVYIDAPRPHVSVEVSAPGVYVAPPAPPSVTIGVPAPHVIVAAPAPGAVVVGAPGAVVVEHGGRWHGRGENDQGEDHDRGRHNGWGEHHDNGRHEGWGKHGR
jgi:hypothetical protein